MCVVEVAQSCPTLCEPMDYTVHGILQARILERVAFPFSSGSSRPRNQTGVSCIAGGFFINWAIREVICKYYIILHNELELLWILVTVEVKSVKGHSATISTWHTKGWHLVKMTWAPGSDDLPCHVTLKLKLKENKFSLSFLNAICTKCQNSEHITNMQVSSILE